MVTTEESIRSKLTGDLNPSVLDIVNESHHHAGGPGRETHFKVLAVSTIFEGLNRVARQQRVYQLLDFELKNGVHALSLRLLTPAEYEKIQSQFETPNCMGGSTRENI